MYDPDLYDSFSEFQRQDAREFIPYIVSGMNWQKVDTILDFGCGSGFNTKNILVPLLELEDTKTHTNPHLYAIDVSKPMIDFASKVYKHPNVTYMVADVMKDDCEFSCQFDKIFSFHVLHWILDQQKALQHLFSLLKSKGELGMYFLTNAAVFSVYDAMSQIPMWASYLTDVKKFIPKSHFSVDPAKDIQETMKLIGYDVQECVTITREFKFTSMDAMIENAMAANPFIHRIPSELHGEYKQEFKSCFIPFVNQVRDDQTSSVIEIKYDIVLVRARKF